MYPNWFGTLCAAAALAMFFVSHRAAMKMTQRRRLLLALVAVILAIPGASFAAYYAHLLKEPEWYYEFRSWRGTEALLIFVGVAGGVVASLVHRITTTLPFVVVGAFVIVPVLKPFIGPIPDDAFRDQWDGKVCLQSTPSTCGAASVATSLRAIGLTASERELARESYSYAGGTEAWYLARSVRRRGGEVKWNFHTRFDPELPLPAMTGVRFGQVGHFIAILSREGDQFHIGDPLNGQKTMSLEQLLARYQFTGFFMSISRSKSL